MQVKYHARYHATILLPNNFCMLFKLHVLHISLICFSVQILLCNPLSVKNSMHSSNTVHSAQAEAVPFVTGQLMRKYVNRTFIKLRGIELNTDADSK